jgi:hypothetical protein
MYPCSPIQNKILWKQAQSLDYYNICVIWEVESQGHQPVDILMLQEAWQCVVDRHSILRTVFIQR